MHHKHSFASGASAWVCTHAPIAGGWALSKSTRQRHWHGAVPLAIAAASMAALAALWLASAPSLAFCCMVQAFAGMEATQGPAWSWPAVLLPKEVAVMGGLLHYHP